SMPVLVGSVVGVDARGLMSRMAVAATVVALATGCGGSAGQSIAAHPAGAQAGGNPSPAGQLKTISVRISNGTVDGVPARVEVNRGEGVRLEVTSDSSDH